jgi:hypothetical protein
MSLPNTQQGGTTGVQGGSLKRKLETIVIARLSSSEGTTLAGVTTFRLLLKNLFGVLNLHIACGLDPADSGNVIRPAAIPVNGAGTMQLTPINNFPDAKKVYLRPVFQDPAGVSTENHPLPENIPFGWEDATEADEVEIEVILSPDGWAGTGLNANIDVQVTVEYNGEWWDQKAIQFALSQVTLQGSSVTVPIIATGGG